MTKATRGARAAAVPAIALALALAAPASALAEEPAVSGNGSFDKPGDTVVTAVEGTVKATTITVSVPTQVAFYIDPGAEPTATLTGTFGKGNNKVGQYTNPTNFTVTNHSAVDVYGYVSGVGSPHATLVNDNGQLAKSGGLTPSESNKDKTKLQVGICADDEQLNLKTAGDWLTEDIDGTKGKRYFAFNRTDDGTPQGKLVAAEDKASSDETLSTGGKETLTIRGAVFQGGWSQHDNLLVNVKFKIVTDPDELEK